MRATAVPPRLLVVVVDPYTAGCDALCACVAELGHDAVGACSAEIAEQIVRHVAVDLVIVDHCPPWFDGCALVARLRRARWVPAIILEGIADGLAISGALVLQRPFSFDDLERGISRVREPELAAEARGDR